MALCFRHCKKLNVVGAGFRTSALWIMLSCQCGLNWFDMDMEQHRVSKVTYTLIWSSQIEQRKISVAKFQLPNSAVKNMCQNYYNKNEMFGNFAKKWNEGWN